MFDDMANVLIDLTNCDQFKLLNHFHISNFHIIQSKPHSLVKQMVLQTLVGKIL